MPLYSTTSGTVVAQTTQPSSSTTGDIWVDTSAPIPVIKIYDGTTYNLFSNTQIAAAAAIAKSKLAGLAIVNADVDAAAAIAKSKLAGLAIVNADVDTAAAIARSKLVLDPTYSHPVLFARVDETTMFDDFGREVLNPTGMPTYYTVALVGTGTAVPNGINLALTTSGAASDVVDLRLSGLMLNRVDPINRGGGVTAVDMYINFSLGQTTACKFFCGIVYDSIVALTALPSTAIHIGLQYDSVANANFRTTSSNGATQALEDTTQAATTGEFVARINITDSNTATVRFYSVSGWPRTLTLIYTDTVTALGTSDQRSASARFFILTSAAATKSVNIQEWSIYWT